VRTLRKVNSDKDAAKIMYDNFISKHNFTSEQTDVIAVGTLGRDPMTLRQTLKADRKLVVVKSREAPKIGGLYYSSLRSQFRCSHDPHELLKPPPTKTSETIDPVLLRAMISTKRNAHDREQWTHYLGLKKTPNESETCGMFRYALGINPWNKDHLGFGLDVLSWVVNNGISALWPDKCHVMRSWVDETLQSAWQLSKVRGVTLADFISLHRHNLHLIIDKEDLNIVTKCDDDKMHQVTAQVTSVVESSGIGEALFHNIMIKVAAKWMEDIVKPFLLDFAKVNITHETLLDATTAINCVVTGRLEAKYVKDYKLAVVEYRGLLLNIAVKSKEERFAYQLHAIIKGIGVESGVLPELEMEKVLHLSKDHYIHKVSIDADLLQGSVTARRVFDQALRDAGCDSADTVNQLLNMRLTDLMTIDRKFRIEEAIVLTVTGPGAMSRLIKAVLKALPDATTSMEPEICLQKLQFIERQSVFKLAPRESQAKVQVALKLIEKLVANRQPSLDDIKQDTFLSDVVSRLQYFVRIENPAFVAGSGLPAFLFGASALIVMLAEVQQSDTAGKLLLKDLAVFTVYNHLMTPEMEQLLQPIMKNMHGQIASVDGKRPTKKNKSSSSTCDPDDVAMQAAMAEFR
jgi:hypothetical protein